MATFLQLFVKTVRECGLTEVPTEVEDQTGELLRIVNYLIDGHSDIQLSKDDWRWMRQKFTLATTSGDDDYAFGDCTDVATSAAITRFKSWRLNDRQNPPFIYLTSAGVAGQTILSWPPRS